MKRNKILILAMLFCFLILGCSNIGGENSANSSLPSGVIRVAIGLSQTPRYAMPSVLQDCSSLVFAAALKPNGQTVAAADLTSATYSSVSGTSYVSVPFETENSNRENYTLHIFAFPQSTNIASLSNINSALLYGSSAINIPAGYSFAEISEQIALESFSNSETGTINLTATIPSGFQFSASCKTSGHTHSDLTCTVSGTTVTISGSVPIGAHDILFSLKKNSEVLYIWQEAVFVYSGMETNYWSGGAKEIKQEQLYTTLYVSGTSGSSLLNYVPDGADGSIAKPYSSVQSAIDKIKKINDSNTEYKIYVDGVVEQETTVMNIASSAALKLLVAGMGTNAALKVNRSTYSSNGTVAKFSGSGLNITLKNLTITGGKSSSNGGGINVASGNVTLKNCKVESNTVSSGQGGGIYASGGTLTLEDCSITSNTADTNGGGIYNAGATIKITSGSITGNTATNNGGGIYNNGNLEMSGNFTFSDTNNIYLPSGKTVTVAGGVSGTNLKIKCATNGQAIKGTDGYTLTKNVIENFSYYGDDKFIAVQKNSGNLYGYVFTRSGDEYTADSSVVDFANYLMSIPTGSTEKTVVLSTNLSLSEPVVLGDRNIKITTDGNDDRTITNSDIDSTGGTGEGSGVYNMFYIKRGYSSGFVPTLTLEGKNGKNIILDGNDSARIIYINGVSTGGNVGAPPVLNIKENVVLQCGNALKTGYNTSGGGVEVAYATFNLNGGTITNCKATAGGGVGMNNNGTFNFITGTISTCTGGGVYGTGTYTANISASAVFSDNSNYKFNFTGTNNGTVSQSP